VEVPALEAGLEHHFARQMGAIFPLSLEVFLPALFVFQ
jgi:hypothetical protein